MFEQNPELVSQVGRDGDVAKVEQYVCKVYSAPDPTVGVNQARLDMFEKVQKDLDKLPPTKDALELHFQRANLQAKVCLQSNEAMQTVGSPAETGGWRMADDGSLEVVWTRLPVLPEACIELVTCGCKSKCKTAQCKCLKSGQRCITACKCDAEDCKNPAGLDETERSPFF